MPKQRDLVRMSEAEITAFLGDGRSLQVATIGKDGAPHLTTVWYAVSEGRIMFETYGTSQKVVNLRRDARIALLVEDGLTYDQLRGVSINGRAEVVDAEPRKSELMRFLFDRHFPGLSPADLAEMAERMGRKRVVIAVTPEHVMSWDHRKLAAKGP